MDLKDFKCFCGKPSVRVDTWFRWYPCRDHVNLSPVEYREEEIKEKEYGN